MDVHTREQRSYNMSQIRNKNTKPEILLRKMLWQSGLRGYRINAKLPGKPDIYFPKHKIAVFVDGCFWHKCPECYVRPKTNREFWKQKINENTKRDFRVNKELEKMHIRAIRLWEHQVLQNPEESLNKVIEACKIG